MLRKKRLSANMKSSLTLSFVALLLLASCGSKHHRQEKHEVNPECVYVCSGPVSKRYHSVEDCDGLKRCSGGILRMTADDAERIGKTPCRLCIE